MDTSKSHLEDRKLRKWKIDKYCFAYTGTLNFHTVSKAVVSRLGNLEATRGLRMWLILSNSIIRSIGGFFSFLLQNIYTITEVGRREKKLSRIRASLALKYFRSCQLEKMMRVGFFKTKIPTLVEIFSQFGTS